MNIALNTVSNAVSLPPQALPLPPEEVGVIAPNAYRASLRLALQHACRPWVLEPASAALLASLGRGHRIRARSQVLSAGGGRAESLWLLVNGRLSMGKRDAAGRWWQSGELEPGDWIDVASAWMGESYPETALALSPALVHEFPVEDVSRFCLGDAALTRVLLACVASRARCATLDKQALLTKDIQARLASWLLQQLEHDGGGTELRLRQQKKDIASQLGVTPETLSRNLRQLQDEGLLQMQGYRLHFPATERLRALAERRPPRYSR